MEETFSFGYWIRRRRRALDLTQASLAYQVGCATVSIRKIERDERRPSRTMAERLAEMLAIPVTERETFIRCGLGEVPVDVLPVSTQPLSPPPELIILKESIEPVTGIRDRFVGRKRELARLEAELEFAFLGEGRIAFIAGEAGCGKTALITECARRAIALNPDLLVVGGNCTAYAGIGDPYLPFREMIGMLTCDVESHWSAAAHSRENLRRLWRSLPITLQALVEHGSHLIEIFVSGKGLLTRAASVAPSGTAWLIQLQAEVARRQDLVRNLEQKALFGQFTNVLHRLAEQHPLLILLDDLHWADDASISLLFHLGRRLSGSRILILGTFRPEELASRRGSESHPLEEVVGEFKRTYGDVWIDLAASDLAEGKDFVDAFLDMEPNRFGETFRKALFQQTEGNPLFIVELLHEMKTHGDLVQDSTGHWSEGKDLDWKTLPARIEAVIARRLDRLDEAMREILNIASVEGELFTAEVVARVKGMDEWQLLNTLSQQLAKRHRLVRERGESAVGGRYLSPYQFSHILFQGYLYQQLDPGERRRLHRDVANALEALYQEQTEEIALQLARHYQEARLPHKAVDYLQQAGEKAMRLYAHEEAVALLSRSLALLQTLPAASEHVQQELDIRIKLSEAQQKASQFSEALDTLEPAAAIARKTGSAENLARVALGYEESRWRFNLPTEPTVKLIEEALSALGNEESVYSVRLSVRLVKSRMSTRSPEQIFDLSQQALDMARRVNDPLALYDALYLKILGPRRPEHSADRMVAINEMLQLADEFGSREGALEVKGFRLLEYLEQGDIRSFRAEADLVIQSMEETKEPLFEYFPHLVRMVLALVAGRFEEAEQQAQHAFEIGRQMREMDVDGVFGIQMFTIRREQGRLRELAPLVKMFVEQNPSTAIWRPGLALIYSELGLKIEARKEFESLAADDFASLPEDALWATCIVYLSEVCAFLGDPHRAAYLYRLLLPYKGRTIVVGFLSACFGAASRFLGMLAKTMSRWEEAEEHFQDAIELNNRIEAVTWLAHTKHQYAAMLLARGLAEDRLKAMSLLDDALQTASEHGMDSLTKKIEALRH